ncbi:MAG: copper chaperone PCu(A)C [Halothiobacillus sp.]|jgi:copper(I)-binding protein|nr:copper chaperone PCu(A)C [Halothiobacillus sp.]
MKQWFVGSMILMMSFAAQAAPVISGPWIPEQPPGAMASAVFLTMKNSSDQPEALIKATAPGFKAVQMHKSIQVDGMHRMIEEKEIAIPAHGETQLAPGGYHIMLIGPKNPLVAGDHVPLTLTFSDGTKETLQVPVKKRAAMTDMMSH